MNEKALRILEYPKNYQSAYGKSKLRAWKRTVPEANSNDRHCPDRGSTTTDCRRF